MRKVLGPIASLAAGLLLAAVPAAGQFEKYVADGDSITAGVQGGCLVERHQTRAYPGLIADQLGISDFQEPLVSEKALAVPLTGNACLGAVIAGGTITVGAVSQQGDPKNTLLPRPYDNLGIPSARAMDLVDLTTSDPTLGGVQASAALVLRNVPGAPLAGTSALDQTNLLSPDLVTLWIGNNDVLGAATSGVALEGVTLTPAALFQAKYGAVVDGLAGAGRTLVVLNVPDVAAIAFTTTVAPFIVNPANGAQIPLLGPGNAAFPCPSADPCPLPPGTLVTLPAASLIRSGVGVPAAAGGTGLPLPDGGFTPPATLDAGVILYPDEVAAIQARTDELNAIIAAEASAGGAILVDANAIFDQIRAEGYEIGGLTLTASLLTGGIFSADGVHPSNIAHAIVADEIIQAINAAQGTEIERPNLFDTLFAADVPAPAPAGASLGFTRESWRSLLAEFPPIQAAVEVVLPSERPHRSTRVIRR